MKASSIIRLLGATAVAAAALLPSAFRADGAPRPEKERETALTAAEVFRRLPADVLDLLPAGTRSDMLAYYEADSIWEAPNALEGLSSLDSVAPDYLKVNLTPVSSLQIRLYSLKDGGQRVMAVYSTGAKGEAADSDIRFFDSSLTEIPRDKVMKMPRLEDFFSIPKGSVTTMKEIREMLPFYTVEYDASAPDGILRGKLTVGEFVNVDDYNILKLFLRPEVAYRWDGKKMKLNNK